MIIGLAVSAGLAAQQASAESTSAELAQLRDALAAQQKQLDAQQEQIEHLKALIVKQSGAQISTRTTPVGASCLTCPNEAGATGPTAITRMTDVPASSNIQSEAHAGGLAKSAAAAPGGQTPPPAKSEVSDDIQPINPGQEVAGEQPTGPPIEIGPAELRFGGYLGVTGIYRSTNSGGGAGSNFNSIPFSSETAGDVSEARLTAQSTRLSMRVDANFPDRITRFNRLAGYFEMDFNGATPGAVAVTSTGVGFRLRHAFAETQYGESWLLAVGQAFTLMTPAKGQLSIWPSDVEMSQAVDTNYLAGMVWNRTPQFRLTYRPSQAFNWAFSVENPEQQVGKGAVTFPICCVSELGEQYNTGSNELQVPNLMPDITTRVAFNTSRVHLDAGGVFRVFRHSLNPHRQDVRQIGGGGNVNLGLQLSNTTRLLVQGSYGAGMGRYVGGLVPDVIVRPDLGISPIITTSWVTGVEQGLTSDAAFSAYYSGIYANNNFALDSDGRWVGYGFPDSSGSNNRIIHEATGIIAIRVFKSENRGSVQFNNQFSWLSRSPWAMESSGLRNAASFMFLGQMRYNLP